MNKKPKAENKEAVSKSMPVSGANKSPVKVSDVFVVIICISGIAYSLYLFQQDLFMSLRSLNTAPAGTVSVKYNTVQRRIQDRMIWDRLFNESPVYNGDLIRVSRLSGATLNINENHIELGENTLIRIQNDAGPLQIDFFSGGINITSNTGSAPVLVSIGDKVVEAAPGAVFSAQTGVDSSGGGSLMLRVTEGSARIVQGEQITRASAGDVIIQDASGKEVREPAAAVIHPRPNAQFLKTGDSPLNIEFSWTRINFLPDDRLRLETARDRNFLSDVRSHNNLETRAAVSLNTGVWHWRLIFEDKILSSGRLTVAEAPAPMALSPAPGRVFNVKTSSPEVQIRWSEIPDSISYILQVSPTPEFINPVISVDVKGTSFIASNLDAGTWHWRVQSVFPPVIEGERPFSHVSSFQIVQTGELPAPSLSTPLVDAAFTLTEKRNNIYLSWVNVREAAFYTVQVSNDSGLSNPVLIRQTGNNYYIFGNDDVELVPGRYYWSVSYTDSEGNASAMSQIRSFITMEREVIQKLVFPPDRYSVEDAYKGEVTFSWETNLPYDLRFQVSADADFSKMEIDQPVSGNSFSSASIAPGDWYWRITARADARSVSVPVSPRRLTIIPPPVIMAEAPAPAATTPTAPMPSLQTPMLSQSAAPPPLPVLRVTLISPAQNASIPGLTALREPTVFRWASDIGMESSRFVLSRNANPASGRPEIEIQNPGREVVIDRLGEGAWYWTVEGVSGDGRTVTASSPVRLNVQPIPFLPPPENRLPVNGYTIGIEELKEQRNIEFKWSEVKGANRYILTIFRAGSSGYAQRQIFQTDPMTELNFIFDNLTLLENHENIFWHVEALFYGEGGRIEQRGQVREYTIALNVPRPGRIRIRDAGVLYGTQ